MSCFWWLVILAGGIFLILSMVRWFEQATEAVVNGWWNKVFLLILFPFTAWFFPSRVSAGRPTPVPLHEPVRGFGTVPKAKAPTTSDDGPPPGTPKEFLEKPKITPKKVKSIPIDPDKIAKLKQQMRDQGMME